MAKANVCITRKYEGSIDIGDIPAGMFRDLLEALSKGEVKDTSWSEYDLNLDDTVLEVTVQDGK